MAYNNYFPVGYQQYYPQPQMMAQQSQAQQSQPMNSSLIWVQGEAGAKSYLVAPNTTVQLWDSESQVIYLKSADASGMPSMKILDYKIRESAQPSQSQVAGNLQSTEYVTRDELTAFENKIREQIAGFMSARGEKEEKTNEQSAV